MKIKNSLPFRNLVRRPGRSTALLVLTLFLTFAVLGGSLLISGLKSGLDSLEARLGADIMVVPYEATTKSDLSNMILQGNPGYFYMDDSVVEELESIEGVGQISEQFYLASTSSSCCSYKVQLIGFDPETDFTITPWVQNSYTGELQDMQVFVGNDLNAFAGDELQFYGTTVTVAARLEKTGTYLDTAVYMNEYTIKHLIEAAKESQIYDFGDVDPYQIVSCVLINVAEGYNVEEVANDINIHVKKVEAVRTQTMVEDTSQKLTGISTIAGGLIVVVWVLVLVILVLAFTMIANERKKEFAVLRILGSSRKKLSALLMTESLLVSVVGSVAGAAVAILTMLLFTNYIEDLLGLPFLLPGLMQMSVITVVAILVSIAASSLSSALCAYRISKMDPALILRGEN